MRCSPRNPPLLVALRQALPGSQALDLGVFLHLALESGRLLHLLTHLANVPIFPWLDGLSPVVPKFLFQYPLWKLQGVHLLLLPLAVLLSLLPPLAPLPLVLRILSPAALR